MISESDEMAKDALVDLPTPKETTFELEGAISPSLAKNKFFLPEEIDVNSINIYNDLPRRSSRKKSTPKVFLINEIKYIGEENDDWKLNEYLFDRLESSYGKFSSSCFASLENSHTTRYFVKRNGNCICEHGCNHADFFTFPHMEKFLLHEHVYANPPYNMTDIKKLIKVVTENKYIFKGVLILPDWDEVKELLRTLKSEIRGARRFIHTNEFLKRKNIFFPSNQYAGDIPPPKFTPLVVAIHDYEQTVEAEDRSCQKCGCFHHYYKENGDVCWDTSIYPKLNRRHDLKTCPPLWLDRMSFEEEIPEPFGSDDLRDNWLSTGKSEYTKTYAAIENTKSTKVYRNQINLSVKENGLIDTGEVRILPPPENFSRDEWIVAEQAEIAGLLALDVMTLVPISQVPYGTKVISTRFVHVVKSDNEGNPKLKARYVVRGYGSIYTVHHLETHSPTPDLGIVRLAIVIAANYGWKIYSADVTKAFIHADLKQEVYCSYPGDNNNVWKLKKALYGLKNAPLAWQNHLTNVLKKYGFEICNHATSTYRKFSQQEDPKNPGLKKLLAILIVYVDDLLFFCEEESMWTEFNKNLQTHLPLTDIGIVKTWCGIEIVHTQKFEYQISQAIYISQILLIYKEELKNIRLPETPEGSEDFFTKELMCQQAAHLNSNNVSRYRKLLGILQWVVTVTRPDLACAVSRAGMVSNNPSDAQYKALLRILAYLSKYPNLPLVYKGDQRNSTAFTLVGFSDSDHAGDPSLKSRTASIIMFANNMISWTSKLQTLTAGSSGHAEVTAMFETSKRVRSFAIVLQELNILVHHVPIFVDSENALSWAFDGTTKLTKHYQIRLQTIREYVRSECIVPFKVDTKDNLADLLTKSKVTGGNDSFKRLRDLMFIGGRQEMMENLLKDGFRHATRYPSFQIWKNKATNVRAEELAEIPEVFTSERNIAYTVMDNYHFKEAEPTVSYSPGTANDFISG